MPYGLRDRRRFNICWHVSCHFHQQRNHEKITFVVKLQFMSSGVDKLQPFLHVGDANAIFPVGYKFVFAVGNLAS